MSSAEIHFLPHNRTVTARKGTPLLEAARDASIAIESPCNGKGTCGKCRVQVVDGALGAPHEDERGHLSSRELEEGVRLACRSTVAGKAVVRSLDGTAGTHRILSDGLLPDFALEPHIAKSCVALPPPTLEDNGADLERLGRALGCALADGLPVGLLRDLPGAVRRGGGTVTAVCAGERLIGVEPGDTTARSCGVAVDIGTTTVAATLIDLTTGNELAHASMVNPQKRYGQDVLTRIHHLKEHPDALWTLGMLIREGVDGLVGELCRDAGVGREEVYEVVVAANTTMTHLFLGVDPAGLGAAPYAPAFTAAVSVPASELEMRISPFGIVSCLPAVSGFVGGDITAGLIATELAASGATSLLIDIGTNGEIVLATGERLFACSCAAGPALEGMNISCGMRAADGAIERVTIGETVEVKTIGGRSPVGICGSGIIDAVAELVKVGAVGSSGRFARPAGTGEPLPWHEGLRTEGGSRFVLCEAEGGGEIAAVTQKDVRQVQLAKGAILSGILALTSRLGIAPSDVERVYIAGAFGCHVRKENLGRLGLIPREWLDRVVLAGNSSKSGAVLALLSRRKRREAAELAGRVQYLELSCHPGYDRLFADSLAFPREGA